MMSQSQCHISFLSFTHITSTQNNMPHINLNVSLYCVSISTSPRSTAAGIALTLIVEFCAIIALSMFKYTLGDVCAYLEVIVDCLNAKRCVCIRIKFIFMETRPDTRHKSFAVFVSARRQSGYGRTDRRTDGPTDRPTDRPTDGHTLL